MELREIIDRIDAVSIPKDATITQLKRKEDNEPYRVWRIDTGNARYILKEAKEGEAVFHSSIFATVKTGVPSLYQVITTEENTYLLMDYIEGEDLCKCDRTKLTLALDALIALQRKTWEMEEFGPWECSFDNSLLQRQNRGEYLNDPLLEKAYEKFLRVYQSVPKALCHDDLLPFNIIVGNEKAFLIDWECGGVLPYPTSFARLIAHTGEDKDALFYMTSADKYFAIEYYYDNFLKDKGISYSAWRNTLEHFLLYEYCEWVYVGNKYDATGGEYYKKYLPIAMQQASKILKIENG